MSFFSSGGVTGGVTGGVSSAFKFSVALFLLIPICLSAQAAALQNSDSSRAADWSQQIDKLTTWEEYEGGWKNSTSSEPLATRQHFVDSIIQLEYRFSPHQSAKVYFFGRYAYDLSQYIPDKTRDEIHKLELWFRSPRFDEARKKLENARLLKVVLNGKVVEENREYAGLDEGTLYHWEQPYGQHFLLPLQSSLKLQYFRAQRADFSAVTFSSAEQGESNIAKLVDYVELGKQHFRDFGCVECHAVNAEDKSVKSGPNLFGLMQFRPREIEVVEGGEGHRFTIKADTQFLINSVREPQFQLAIGRGDLDKARVYQPVMPPYNEQILSTNQLLAIGDYLRTLNEDENQGPIVNLQPQTGPAEYKPLEDPLLLLVGERTRIQRGPMPGTSARAIHVGLPNGINYSFDPRVLGIVKIWQGGFLNMEGEFLHRGGRGLEPGFKAGEIRFDDQPFLLAPLDKQGKLIDFSFKEALFRDVESITRSMNSKRDHIDMLTEINAQFLGYSLDSKDKKATPQFLYRVGKNRIALDFQLYPQGQVTFRISGELNQAQQFAINTATLSNVKVDKGKFENGKWLLPKRTQEALLTAEINLTDSAWTTEPNDFNFYVQPLQVRANNKALLPAGYTVEDLLPPKDNFGREQLFEAMGLAQAADGTIVVATRTAGIWRIKNNSWHYFAEGTFDSMGVVIEDKHGLVLTVGQKPELTRIADTNGDGRADEYHTLFDAFSYHGNYHTYMHGPLKTGDGNYLINLNLAHDNAAWRADGKVMGTFGGYSGWALLVDKKAGDFKENKANGFVPFASGLRSPAGLGISPDGRLWYTDNQGDYLGTSKMFEFEKNAFYSHPVGLIDKPGMQPDSTAITWDKVKDKRKAATILFPHNRLANSPGHLVWDTTEGKFGAFDEQVFVGDQTLSTLMRISLEKVAGVEQGAVFPFAENLGSGVMRPLFLEDGSLLLGQTGRGWRANGGEVTALQRVTWKQPERTNEILDVNILPNGFKVNFTSSVQDFSAAALAIESWRYRDAPDYGSPELDLRKEKIVRADLSKDKKSVVIELAAQQDEKVHPQQTARIYHIALQRKQVFAEDSGRALEAYYTVNAWPQSNE